MSDSKTKRHLEIAFLFDRNNKPVAVVENFPGLFAEMRPEQMRAMGAALIQIAADCEANLQYKAKTSYPW